jgi:1,4-alpha-glucan branching enzyme
LLYAFSEQFVLPFSHDEVVHGKGSLLQKMPGDDWQKFAGLRLLLSYQFTHPGKKLLFMGNDLGMWTEWHENEWLRHDLNQYAPHGGIQRLVRDLNRLYRTESALHELDGSDRGFEWIDCHDSEQSVLSFVRRGRDATDHLVVIANFTPVVRSSYRIGVPHAGWYREVFNSDAGIYWGANVGNLGRRHSDPLPFHRHHQSLELILPPLGLMIFKPAIERTPAAT